MNDVLMSHREECGGDCREGRGFWQPDPKYVQLAREQFEREELEVPWCQVSARAWRIYEDELGED